MLTPIPATGNTSHPTTPLTARIPEGNYFSQVFQETPQPHISHSLRPFYSTSRKMSNNQSAPTIQRIQRGFAPMAGTGPPLYTPTSPLSPSTPPQGFSARNRQEGRRPIGRMSLSGLPKYHPANFSSQDNSPAPLPPRASRSVTSQPRPGRGSVAQQQLQQHRREQLSHAAKHSSSMLSSSSHAKPSPPRLAPLMSPGEPMTPLQLEGQGDYMSAGSGSSSGLDGVDGRDMVERLVQRENERRNHPEARSGSVSPALSPAVSPAGGRR